MSICTNVFIYIRKEMEKKSNCLVCNEPMKQRGGKNVCSGTCRRRKHEMNKYFDAVYENVKRMVKCTNDKVYEGMKRDVKRSGQNVVVFEDWLSKRSK